MKNESLVIMVLILIYSISFSNNKFLSLSKPIDLDIVVPNNNFPSNTNTNDINKIVNKDNKDTGAKAKNVSIINSNSNNKQINITRNSNSHNIIYNSQASINEYEDLNNKQRNEFPYKSDTRRERQEINSNNINNRDNNDDEKNSNLNNLSQINSTIESKGIVKNRLSHKHQMNNSRIFRTSSNVNNYIPNMSDIHILHKKTLPDDLDNTELVDNKSDSEGNIENNNNNIYDNNDEETQAIDPKAYGVLKNKYTTEYEDSVSKDSNNNNKTNIVNNDLYYDYLKNSTFITDKENNNISTANDNLSNVLNDIKDNLDLMSSPFIPSTGFPFVPSIDDNIFKKGKEKEKSNSRLDNKDGNNNDNNKKITVVNKYYFDNKNTILKTPNNANVYNYYNSTNYENNDFNSDNDKRNNNKQSNKDSKDKVKVMNNVLPNIPLTNNNKKVDEDDKSNEPDISNITELNNEKINVNSNIISNISNSDGFVSPTIVKNESSTPTPTFNYHDNNTIRENNKVSVVDYNSDVRDMNGKIDKETKAIKLTSPNTSRNNIDNSPITLDTDNSNIKVNNRESKNKNPDEDTFYLPYLSANESLSQNTQENLTKSYFDNANFRSNKLNINHKDNKRELINKSLFIKNNRVKKASRLKPIKQIKEKHLEASISSDKFKDNDLLVFLETNEYLVQQTHNKNIEIKEINRLIKENKTNKKNNNKKKNNNNKNHDSRQSSINLNNIKNKDENRSLIDKSEVNSKYDYEFTSNLNNKNNKDYNSDDMIIDEFVKLRVKRIKL